MGVGPRLAAISDTAGFAWSELQHSCWSVERRHRSPVPSAREDGGRHLLVVPDTPEGTGASSEAMLARSLDTWRSP